MLQAVGFSPGAGAGHVQVGQQLAATISGVAVKGGALPPAAGAQNPAPHELAAPLELAAPSGYLPPLRPPPKGRARQQEGSTRSGLGPSLNRYWSPRPVGTNVKAAVVSCVKAASHLGAAGESAIEGKPSWNPPALGSRASHPIKAADINLGPDYAGASGRKLLPL